MPYCLEDLEEEPKPFATPTIGRLKKKISTIRSSPYYHREYLSVQQSKEKEEIAQGETRQTLSLVVNRLPLPVVRQSEFTTVAGLLSVFSKSENLRYEVNCEDEDDDDNDDDCGIRRGDESPLLVRSFVQAENLSENQEMIDWSHLPMACRLSSPPPFTTKLLVAEGSNVNQRNNRGQTLLHLLILGGFDSTSSREALETLLWRGASVSCRDNEGDSPFLCIRHLLKEKQFEGAAMVAKQLLEAGADVNSVDASNQTLLSYSLQHLDNSIDLTKTLFNHGATVWGFKTPGGDDNAFKWLLKGIMRQRELKNCTLSLKLIGQLMCNRPTELRLLVIRTMTRHSKCYQVYGPLFLDLQKAMKKYWKEPQSLRDLCRASIRESFTHGSPSDSTAQLHLPLLIHRFLLFNEATLVPLPHV